MPYNGSRSWYTSTEDASGYASGYKANAKVWNSWVSNTSSATSTSATLQSVWCRWNATGSSTVTSTNTAAVWNRWNSEYQVAAPPARVLETPEQRTRREASLARYEAEEARRREERLAADRRAEALLRAHITREQQEQLEREDWFLIDSASGKQYRINRGRSANIDVLDETGKVLRSLCVHPRDGVPDADTMLSQALMLRHDEETLLRMANVHPANHGFRRRPLVQPQSVVG